MGTSDVEGLDLMKSFWAKGFISILSFAGTMNGCDKKGMSGLINSGRAYGKIWVFSRPVGTRKTRS